VNGPTRRGDLRRLSARIALVSFLAAALCAVAAIVVYWRGADTQWMGALAFVAFGGIGLGLIVWDNDVRPPEVDVEERHPLVGSEGDAEAVDEALGAEQVGRRSLLRRALWLAGGAVGAMILVPLRSLGPAPGRSLLRTGWRKGVRVVTADGSPVHAEAVPDNGLLTVFPASDPGAADGQVVLVRVDPALVQPADGREDWTPQGLVAYSKVCTHAGCPVGLYQAQTHRLLCPCHQSEFDVLHGGAPLTGPAAWPLPQLPLTIDDDGTLRAAGPLSAPVGPGWWKA
jgi:ubiquinol-cytochrome c reductase iron-sulfur subunit